MAASPPDRDRAPGAVLRAVTWNCHGAVGADRRCDPARTLATIARMQPDILALQEVDGRSHLGRRRRAFEFLSAGLTEADGGHIVEARTVRRTDRDYGHLLWSRWPVVSATVHALPEPGFEARAAIEAVLATPAGRLRVLTFHLGLLPRQRRAQARFLAERVDAADEPVLAMGDGNDLRLGGSLHTCLAPRLPVHVAPRSFPGRWPLMRLDRIYASAGFLLAAHRVDAPSGPASDHRAVVADLAWPDGSPNVGD
ncbi:endonuclease/exonuclease/phosphatase family protein [Aurantimonas sp. A2-1-M11]|uniref:endonuclease/exonuclease/phosphatase family protein n=1 Tax=Aurantimonas sp. A2-1-M11 TaxID=3113712 RepID=UPI002F95023E